MNESQRKTVRVDRYVLAEIRSSKAIVDDVAQVASSLKGIRNTELLLTRLLEQVHELVPADRGAVLLGAKDGRNLEPAVFQGNPFDVNREISATVFGDRTALLIRDPGSLLCVPLWFHDSDVGVIYLDSGKSGMFTTHHLNLLIAIAGEVAAPLDYTQYIDSIQAENEQLREYADVDHGLIGNSSAIVDVRNLINKVATSDSSILILGEMGTGKELIARGIHRSSRRSQGPFVAINCAAIPETLIESELFGHERGAFTGAVGLKKGKVEAAQGGTLFLDEIGELKESMQASLLRFLQEREFQRVGGTHTVRSDVRVLSATNRNLKECVEKGTFRGDLYYRLNVVQFRTPSLREIRQDIPQLVDHFIRALRHVGVVKGISPEALDFIVRYDWPGNVRQLQNAIEHALVIHTSEFIEPEDLPEVVLEESAFEKTASSFETNVLQTKKATIERALQESEGNLKAAAVILRISPRHLRRLVRELNVKSPK